MPIVAHEVPSRHSPINLGACTSAAVAAPSFKPDHQADINAYNQSHYVTALAHFLVLAQQSYSQAQFKLGVTYHEFVVCNCVP